MKKFLLVSLVAVGSVILIAGFATPLFAHAPDDGGATALNENAWEAMHEACEDGDWEAMAEAAEEVHGADYGDMPYHNEDNHTHADGEGSMGGHMSGDMTRSGMMGGMH